MVMPNFTEQDYELLSAYLDQMLTEQEKTALEARLAAEPALSAELDAIRATIALIQALPLRKAPRDFTLTREMVRASAPIQPRRSVIRFPAASLLSAAASFIFLVLGMVLVLSSSTESPSPPASDQQVAVAQPMTMIPPTMTAMPNSVDAGQAPIVASVPEAQEQAPTADMMRAMDSAESEGEIASAEQAQEPMMMFAAPTAEDEEIMADGAMAAVEEMAPGASSDDESGLQRDMSAGGAMPGESAALTATPRIEMTQAVTEIAPTDRRNATPKETASDNAPLGLLLLVIGGGLGMLAGVMLFINRRGDGR